MNSALVIGRSWCFFRGKQSFGRYIRAAWHHEDKLSHRSARNRSLVYSTVTDTLIYTTYPA